MDDKNSSVRTQVRIPSDLAYQLAVAALVRKPRVRVSELVTAICAEWLKRNPVPSFSSLREAKK